MSQVALFGDTHGETEIGKIAHNNFKEGKSFTKNDFAIILGDWGFLWKNDPTEKYWLDWMNQKEYNIVVVPGNHDNYDAFEKLPIVDFCGSKAYQVRSNIFVLFRGAVYIFGGKKFFTMGGALSIDKVYRKEGISWWKQEEPSFMEWQNGFNSLKEHNNTVDYIITHDMHETGRNILYGKDDYKRCSVSLGLEEIRKIANYKTWYCGHHHKDLYFSETRTQILYDTYKIIDSEN